MIPIRYFVPLLLALALNNSLFAIVNLLVTDPPTVYIQWLDNASDSMTEADGSSSTAIAPYAGGALSLLGNPSDQDIFFGVMCNRTAGYDVTLTSTHPGPASTKGILKITGSTDLVFDVILSKVIGSFASGATASAQLDLTGATASATAVFAADGDLPLNTNNPNVWRVNTTFPAFSSVSDGLVISGNYTGGVTATVVLK